MSEYVNLNKIVQFLEDAGYVMEYKEFKQTFKDKVRQESYTEEILLNARSLNQRDILSDSLDLRGYLSQGIAVKSSRCDNCELNFTNQSSLDRQEMWLFRCEHIFHTSCVQ